jgi:hypothetical protein
VVLTGPTRWAQLAGQTGANPQRDPVNRGPDPRWRCLETLSERIQGKCLGPQSSRSDGGPPAAVDDGRLAVVARGTAATLWKELSRRRGEGRKRMVDSVTTCLGQITFGSLRGWGTSLRIRLL